MAQPLPVGEHQISVGHPQCQRTRVATDPVVNGHPMGLVAIKSLGSNAIFAKESHRIACKSLGHEARNSFQATTIGLISRCILLDQVVKPGGKHRRRGDLALQQRQKRCVLPVRAQYIHIRSQMLQIRASFSRRPKIITALIRRLFLPRVPCHHGKQSTPTGRELCQVHVVLVNQALSRLGHIDVVADQDHPLLNTDQQLRLWVALDTTPIGFVSHLPRDQHAIPLAIQCHKQHPSHIRHLILGVPTVLQQRTDQWISLHHLLICDHAKGISNLEAL